MRGHLSAKSPSIMANSFKIIYWFNVGTRRIEKVNW